MGYRISANAAVQAAKKSGGIITNAQLYTDVSFQNKITECIKKSLSDIIQNENASNIIIKKLTGGIGQGAYHLILHEMDDFEVILKIAGWLNNEGNEEYFRRQFDHIRSVNKYCDSMIKVFGLLKYENRLYVITELFAPKYNFPKTPKKDFPYTEVTVQ